MRPPKELCGSGDGPNPEQLFAAGFAAGYHSALHAVARQRQIQLLAEAADRMCPYSNATRGNIDIEVTPSDD
jgi:organic hydroperoxide reductase OsmC/OhrA